MDMKLYEKVKAYVCEHEEEIVADLFRLVRIPSVKSRAEEGAPFGKECRRALDDSVALFRENGFEASVKSNGMYGIATYGEGEGDIGIFGHTDVVGVGDDWVFTKPFEPVRIGNTLVGRGVEDNKAGVIGGLYAIKALRDLNIPLRHRIVVFLGAEEESGMKDAAAFAENEKMPVISFVPDNDYPLCVGEKTIYNGWLRAQNAFTSIRGVEGGFAYNVILDDVRITLEKTATRKSELLSLIGDNAAYTLTEQEDVLVFAAHGVTAHASVPERANNAARLAFALLAKMESLPEADRAICASAEKIVAGYNGEGIGIAVSDSVFGKLTAANGMVDLREGKLGISMDIRYGVRHDDEALFAALRDTCAALGFEEQGGKLSKGCLVHPDSEIVQALVGVYREISGNESAKPYLSGGGTYARKLENAFSIGTAVPWKPVDLALPAGHGGAHQSDEVISLPGLLEAIALNVMMLVEGDSFAD